AYTLRAGSPAIGSGPNGSDMGYVVASGASISGEPQPQTWRTEATLSVAGPAIINYRFRLNSGEWSGERSVSEPILLSGLSGTNSVEVVGQNEIGIWQADAEATVSEVWSVDPAVARLWISEVDAHAGQVEIWNDSGADLDLAGYSINAVPLSPAPPLSAGSYRIVDVGGLRTNGAAVVLVDPSAQVVDSVRYGLQIPGNSIARLGRNLDWGLAQPTLGAANIPLPLALRDHLKLNEWLLNSDCLFTSDFVELYNSEALPVSITGLGVDFEPRLGGGIWVGKPLSFVEAGGLLALQMDGDVDAGDDHSDLESSGELGAMIRLLDGGALLDEVVNNSDVADVSGGRFPTGSDNFETFPLPTPGLSVEVIEVETITPLIAIDSVWSYEDSDTDLGSAWRAVGFEDSSWSSGAALLGRETSPEDLPEPLATGINYVEGTPTYYFRRHFEFTGDPSNTELRLRTVLDDGAVIYLNGVELHRLRMEDPVTHEGFASDNVGDADYEGPFVLSAGTLVVGDNVIAVEVHQDEEGSSDIVFGLELEAVVTEQISQGLGDAEAILVGLELTEIMF
ncbi:MAG: hypothetical protein ACR2RV_20295, partial [Verrucomicrobiales bacterium]